MTFFVNFSEKLVRLGITDVFAPDFILKQLIPVDNVDNSANNYIMGIVADDKLLCKLKSLKEKPSLVYIIL